MHSYCFRMGKMQKYHVHYIYKSDKRLDGRFIVRMTPCIICVYSDAMIRLTYRRIGDWHLAEDLVQETFLTACCKSERVCGHKKPVAWLFETLNNLTLRESRRFYHTEVSIQDIAESHELTELPMTCHIPMGLYCGLQVNTKYTKEAGSLCHGRGFLLVNFMTALSDNQPCFSPWVRTPKPLTSISSSTGIVR